MTISSIGGNTGISAYYARHLLQDIGKAESQTADTSQSSGNSTTQTTTDSSQSSSGMGQAQSSLAAMLGGMEMGGFSQGQGAGMGPPPPPPPGGTGGNQNSLAQDLC